MTPFNVMHPPILWSKCLGVVAYIWGFQLGTAELQSEAMVSC